MYQAAANVPSSKRTSVPTASLTRKLPKLALGKGRAGASLPMRSNRQLCGRPLVLHRIVGTEPPSTDHAAAVTFEARSEQRNATTAAISSSVPSRPSGGADRAPSRTCSGVVPVRAAICSARPPGPVHDSTSIAPGATAFTSTPLPLQVSANRRLRLSCAALVTEYGASRRPEGRLADEEETFTIRPPP